MWLFNMKNVLVLKRKVCVLALASTMLLTLCSCGSVDSADVVSNVETNTSASEDFTSASTDSQSSDSLEYSDGTLQLGTDSVKAECLDESGSSEGSSSAASSGNKTTNKKPSTISKKELCIGCKVNPYNPNNYGEFCDDCIAERKCKYCKVGYAHPSNPICDECFYKQQEEKIAADPNYTKCDRCKAYRKNDEFDKDSDYCRYCYNYCYNCGEEKGKVFLKGFGDHSYCNKCYEYLKSTDPCVDCYARIPKNKYKERRCPDCQSKKDSGLVYCPFRSHYVESLYKTTVYCIDCNREIMTRSEYTPPEVYYCSNCGRQVGTDPGMCDPYNTGVLDWDTGSPIWECRWYD